MDDVRDLLSGILGVVRLVHQFGISQTEVFGFLVKQHIGVGQNMSKPTILRYTKGKNNPHISINISISI